MANSELKKMRAEKHNYERWLRENAQYYDQRPECRPIRDERKLLFRSKAIIAAALAMGRCK